MIEKYIFTGGLAALLTIGILGTIIMFIVKSKNSIIPKIIVEPLQDDIDVPKIIVEPLQDVPKIIVDDIEIYYEANHYTF
jgi:hypothetical protein